MDRGTSSPPEEGWLLQGWAASCFSDGYLIDLRLEEAPPPPVMPSCLLDKSQWMQFKNTTETYMYIEYDIAIATKKCVWKPQLKDLV